MTDKNIRVQAKNISKNFSIDYRRDEGALEKLLKILAGKREKRERLALKDVSFSARSGEVVGIIGKNGAGKSTLLKIIAEIYQPGSGEVKTNGSLVYLTSLGLGLEKKLTMRENIYLSGSIMGLEQKEIKQKFNQIVEFSGLRDFVDLRVYQFSTGMLARLSFSITFFCLKHKNPDILLIDEVFGSGADVEFEEKAGKKMEELIRGGSTVLMASHNN
jgi:ABC-type polysaccharide/polyol phosphate transport system ATPase subunit